MTTSFIDTDTICAPATAVGGAISVIRVSGPSAVTIVSKLFSRDITSSKGYSMHYGEIADIDDVIVSIFRAPKSYTGEDSVEISCHGSQFIVSEILRLLQANGCRMAAPGEFTQRAFMNGRMDLSQAEAVADLIASTNKATHQIARNQMKGGISSKLQNLREKLLKLTSLLELELDFSDHEELEFADRSILKDLTEEISSHIKLLLDSFQAGNAIKNGIPVAIIGAPNVGKSTLLNVLLQEERAIVSDIQGTTRDIIEDTMTIGHQKFRFIDTAGIRKTDDTIEQLGIERSIKAVQSSKIIILLTEPHIPFLEINTKDDQYVLKVVNKSDILSNSNDTLDSNCTSSENKTIFISAKNGIGITELIDCLQTISQDITSTESEVIVTNIRHQEALSSAYESISRVQYSLTNGISGDLIAQDLREVLHYLGEITGGEITSNEVLGNIFENFCIGK